MPANRKCPDCYVLPGQPHLDGCDVEQCQQCGSQRLTCKHPGPNAIWTGEMPWTKSAFDPQDPGA